MHDIYLFSFFIIYFKYLKIKHKNYFKLKNYKCF